MHLSQITGSRLNRSTGGGRSLCMRLAALSLVFIFWPLSPSSISAAPWEDFGDSGIDWRQLDEVDVDWRDKYRQQRWKRRSFRNRAAQERWEGPLAEPPPRAYRHELYDIEPDVDDWYDDEVFGWYDQHRDLEEWYYGANLDDRYRYDDGNYDVEEVYDPLWDDVDWYNEWYYMNYDERVQQLEPDLSDW